MSKTSLTVNLGKEQYKWVKSQPRDFNFSAFIRQLLDDKLGDLKDADKNIDK